jgi:hypothetical protein
MRLGHGIKEENRTRKEKKEKNEEQKKQKKRGSSL